MEQIKTRFRVHGKLVVDIDGMAGEPLEVFEKMKLFEAKSRVIRQLSDLSGSVVIANSQDALSYVRLRTSPTTFHLIHQDEERVVELIANDLVNLDFFFGDKQKLAGLKKEQDGSYGICSATMLKRYGIPTASVRQSGSEYLVSRSLLVERYREKRGRTIPMRFEERVGPGGQYRVVSKTKLPDQYGEWFLPRFS